MRIAVTFPLYANTEDHKKYLDLTVKSLRSKKHDIVLLPIENFINPALRPLPYEDIDQLDSSILAVGNLTGRQPQSVARGWNDGIRLAAGFKCKYILVINADIVLKSDCIDRLVEFGEANPDITLWSAGAWADLETLEQAPQPGNTSEHPSFSCFMVRPNFFDNVGQFDESITPAYFEDNDMHARIALLGLKAVVWDGAWFHHFGSRAMAGDPDLARWIAPQFDKNRDYFAFKWGSQPVNEVEQMRQVYYKHPYNDPAYSLKQWGKQQ